MFILILRATGSQILLFAVLLKLSLLYRKFANGWLVSKAAISRLEPDELHEARATK